MTAALLYAGGGIVALLAALLPRPLERRPVSLPLVFLALGIGAFLLLPGLPDPAPLARPDVAARVTEGCVLVALFAAGLALDRPVGWHRWCSTWRLLAVTMPVCIVAVALAGAAAGLPLAAALLLGAVLAPTDPVLAADVHVGEPSDDERSEDEPRFALTSEAGLNDGLAFPAVHLALALAAVPAVMDVDWGHWLLVDVAWRLAAGLAAGIVAGRLLGRLVFRPRLLPEPLADQAEGFVALGCVAVSYGAAELAHGYGFVAVFVCACGIRAAERSHGYHQVLHAFTEQVGRLMTVGVLLLLGGSIARGALGALRPLDVAVVAVLMFAVRPLAGWAGLARSGLGRRDRWVVGFFGVRGVGSLYYVAYAAAHAGGTSLGPSLERLYAIVTLAVLASVVVHGVLATPVMRRLDRAREHAARRAGNLPVGDVTV